MITASLCDSRSCNQTGGGEHLKSDIEDLLSLLPPPPATDLGDKLEEGRRHRHHRTTLTTCFGLCNHSPNLKLKLKRVAGSSSSSRPLSLRRRRGKLVNDGGLRMRIQSDSDKGTIKTDDFIAEVEVTDTVTVSNATISKVAWTIGLDGRSFAVRAVECKSQGDKFLRENRYDDALKCYIEGRALLVEIIRQDGRDESDDDNDDLRRRHYLFSSVNKLLLKLVLSCVKTRVQWAAKSSEKLGDGKKKADMLLRLAAGDAFRVLVKSLNKTDNEIDDTTMNSSYDGRNDDAVRSIIAKVVHCSAGLQTQTFISIDDGISEEDRCFVPSLYCDDVPLAIQFCSMLADAWRGLLVAKNRDHGHEEDLHANIIIDYDKDDGTTFVDGSLIAYRGALSLAASPSVSKVRVLRAKERRRIERAIAAISSDTVT